MTDQVWVVPEPEPFQGATVGAADALVTDYLAWQRHTFRRICAGLTGEQLARQAVEPSDLSLLGLIRHLTMVERVWFRMRFGRQDVERLWPRRSDVDFRDADPAHAEADHARYLDELRLADQAVAGMAPDAVIDNEGEVLSLRFVRLHVIGEYARHNGHADLLRQRIDGRTGI